MKGLGICLWFLVSSTILLNWGNVKCSSGETPPKYSGITRALQVETRRCVEKLSFYQDEEIIQEIE